MSHSSAFKHLESNRFCSQCSVKRNKYGLLEQLGLCKIAHVDRTYLMVRSKRRTSLTTARRADVSVIRGLHFYVRARPG
jgi:hypothetical protein